MRTYIAKRLLQAIPLLLAISVVSFFIMQLAPGDYLDTIRMNPNISDEFVDNLKESYGLDKSPVEQYFMWLGKMLRFDFGHSFEFNIPVIKVIAPRLLNTLILAIAALIVSWIIGILIGVYSAVNKYSIGDNILSVFAFVGLSIPNFFFALLLLFFIVRFRIDLPVGGMTSINYDWLSPWGKFVDVLKHLIVPAAVIGTASMARVMRQMRGQMIDAMRQDYIRTARAKGLSEKKVVYKHALRNAVNPLITLLGMDISILLSGAALTETVTGWPGLGKMMLDAVIHKDVYLVMGGLMIASVILIIGNLLADVTLAVVDPRIRYD